MMQKGFQIYIYHKYFWSCHIDLCLVVIMGKENIDQEVKAHKICGARAGTTYMLSKKSAYRYTYF